ncbi:hypothetical protein QYE76_069485 [Lolium multiflorum]|uniref:CCHC-type domain-containing protein n=1 Tax=Lolium multiflorum TaxID=4521 RepID=A0AAD8WDJ4_LOLMU|nr:hypothetical protein QYE76_069485 [Lolium multiflorum]
MSAATARPALASSVATARHGEFGSLVGCTPAAPRPWFMAMETAAGCMLAAPTSSSWVVHVGGDGGGLLLSVSAALHQLARVTETVRCPPIAWTYPPGSSSAPISPCCALYAELSVGRDRCLTSRMSHGLGGTVPRSRNSMTMSVQRALMKLAAMGYTRSAPASPFLAGSCWWRWPRAARRQLRRPCLGTVRGGESLPHPGDCVHSRPGEQASETPSVEILHRETGDKVFGERLGATARSVRVLLRRIGCFIDRSDYTMGDINKTHGDGGAAAGATFPVAMYVLFLSYLALLLVPCSDLMHVLSLMCVVKYACASVMLLSRHEFSVENIMGSLDVEEKARAKDKHTGGTEGRSAANMVQKNAHKSKGKNKGVSQTTNFKKKGKTEKKDPCWVCGETGHWANRCPQRKGKKCQAGQNSTSVNMVIGNTERNYRARGSS